MMFRDRNRFLVLAAAAVVLVAAVSLAAETAELEQIGVEVTIGAVESSEAIYECVAVVTDLAADRVLSAPRVKFRAGEEARMRSGLQPGISVEILVNVNAAETGAEYFATVSQGAKIISLQQVKVALGTS